MKPLRSVFPSSVLIILLSGSIAHSQSAPPAGATGVCKDGTYTTSATKSGACRGHQGVKEWLAAAPAAAPAAASSAAKSADTAAQKTASTAAAAPAAAKSTAAAAPAAAAQTAKSTTHTSTANMTPAPGGGPGMVWLNTDSNVYHCPGTQYYGKTKQGAYMTEADAKAKGAHADHNHPCTK